MRLLISLPAYNEAATIKKVISELPRRIAGIEVIDVLVLDDGSRDETRAEALSAGVQVISHPANLGLGRTFQDIVAEALRSGADALVNLDADGQFNPLDIPKLLKPIIDGQADTVTASRFLDRNLLPKMPASKKWGNNQVAKLISFVTGTKLYDVSCGFRAYSREALLHLNLFSRFTYTHETLLNLVFKGLRVVEVPVQVRGEREFGQSKVAHNLWKYGYNIFNTIFRTMLDYKPLKFFGWGGVVVFLLGLALDIFVVAHWLATGEITPFKGLGFGGLFLNLFGLLLVIVGLLADMINRVRLTQERILYYEKKESFRKR